MSPASNQLRRLTVHCPLCTGWRRRWHHQFGHLVKSYPPFLSNYMFVHFCKIRALQILAKPSSPFFNLRPGIYPTSPYISIHQQRLTSLGNQVRYVQTRHVDSKHKYNFLFNTNTISFSRQIQLFEYKYNFQEAQTFSPVLPPSCWENENWNKIQNAAARFFSSKVSQLSNNSQANFEVCKYFM